MELPKDLHKLSDKSCEHFTPYHFGGGPVSEITPSTLK